MMEKKKSRINAGLMIFVIAALLLGALTILYPVYLKKQKQLGELQKLEQLLDAKKVENSQLLKEVHGLSNDPRMVEKVAREKFLLCKDGETVILYDETSVE